ncbi:MAG: DUF4115 domain-containing protein [Pseudomonadota bacterium]|nr:DUF4115 domain-containing protein [Pseudomonadota bacterium]
MSANSLKSAGTMLREARQAKGLHIAALAASIKVSQRKLELLEADKVSELPDATFARALAQTVCRSLKIDPSPVLAALPQAPNYRLEGVDEGINAPFRDRPGRHEPTDLSVVASPAVWAPALIVVAALVVYFMPSDWVTKLQAAISGQQATVSSPTTAPVAEVVPSDPVQVEAPAAASSVPLISVSPASAVDVGGGLGGAQSVTDAALISAGAASSPVVGPLHVKAAEASWIEVVDARSQVLVSRMLQPGETVVLDGAMPLKLKVGNAAATEVAFRGQVVDLASATTGNVARLELK